MSITNIIWDWNGTLLDDVPLCHKVVSKLLLDNHLPEISIQEYLDVFTFPIKSYYEAIGFDFSVKSFEELSQEFIHHYLLNLDQVKLYPGTQNLLEWSSERFELEIISAYEHNKLISATSKMLNTKLFRSITGISDNYASSKLHLFQKRLAGENNNNYLLIGDTLHDAEIAQACGIMCILIAHGHQSKEKLKQNSGYFKIVSNLAELRQELEMINS